MTDIIYKPTSTTPYAVFNTEMKNILSYINKENKFVYPLRYYKYIMSIHSTLTQKLLQTLNFKIYFNSS